MNFDFLIKHGNAFTPVDRLVEFCGRGSVLRTQSVLYAQAPCGNIDFHGQHNKFQRPREHLDAGFSIGQKLIGTLSPEMIEELIEPKIDRLFISNPSLPGKGNGTVSSSAPRPRGRGTLENRALLGLSYFYVLDFHIPRHAGVVYRGTTPYAPDSIVKDQEHGLRRNGIPCYFACDPAVDFPCD
jgi:hypothetical protein